MYSKIIYSITMLAIAWVAKRILAIDLPGRSADKSLKASEFSIGDSPKGGKAIISPFRLFLLSEIKSYVQKRGHFEGMSKIKTDNPKRLGPLRTDPEWWNRALLFIILDLLCINISYGIALWVRYDFHYSAIPKEYLFQWIEYMPIHTICTIAVFTAAKLYHSLWKYASVSELLRIIIAQAVSSLLCIWGNSLMGFRMPVTYYVVGGLLQALLVALSRFAYRMMRYIKGMSKPPKPGQVSDDYRRRGRWPDPDS